MAEFTAKDVQALRQATGAGMMDAKKALEENDGDIEAARPVAAREGPGQGRPSSPTARTARARSRVVVDGNVGAIVAAQERDRLLGQGRRLHLARPGPRRRSCVAKGADAVAELADRDRRPQDHQEGEHRGRHASSASRPPTATSSTPTSTCRTAAASTPCSSSSTAATQELAHDIAVHIAFTKPPYLHPRRGRRPTPSRRSARRCSTSPRPRASPSRRGPRSSRAASTPGSRTRCCSSRASSSDDKKTDHRSSSASATLVRFAQVVHRRLRPSMTEPGPLPLVAGPAQAVRRGLRRRGRLRHRRRRRPRASPREIVEVRRRPRRRRRHRGRRRQHLAGHDRRRRRHGPRPGRLHGHAGHGHQRPRPAGHARAARASPPGCSRPSTWPRSPSPTSGAGPSATSRRAGSSSSPAAPATRSSPPTPPPRCGRSRSRPRCC